MTPAECAFPRCSTAPEADALMCTEHRKVRLATSGSWVDDKHSGEHGHG